MSRKKRRQKNAEMQANEPQQVFLSLPRVEPRTPNQEKYFDSLKTNKCTLCIGPAGSGKSLLATRVALEELFENKFKRIILTRPMIEAGKPMGALPGDINEKIWPFLRPVIDEMEDALGNKSVFKSMLSDGVIEFCPFSVMRGRNFKRSFVILDEAQNCGYSQLKMFLTRFGEGSKMVLNGDLSQSDLPKKFQGGLLKVWKSLQGVEEIGSVELTHDDILREPLVERILKRLEDD